MIKKFIQFVNENLNNPNEENRDTIVKFHLSVKLKNLLEKLVGEYKVVKLMYDLIDGIPMKYLSKDPVDYLNIEDDGNISYLKSRYFDDPLALEALGDVWKNGRRINTKANRILKEIYNEEYINSKIVQTDVELFLNKLATIIHKGAKVEEYRGEELLRGYNYNHELTKSFGHSCANFNQKELGSGYKEPTIDEYDVYTKNPDNCGVCVVWDEGVIVGRRSFQQGIQVCDVTSNGVTWKKGEHHTVYGNYYGVGGYNSKYDTMIKDYLVSKYNAVEKHRSPGFCVHIETRWKNYPAFDSMYVSFDYNLLTDNYTKLPSPYGSYNWKDTYPSMDHLHALPRYVDARMEEMEKKREKMVQPEPDIQTVKEPDQPPLRMKPYVADHIKIKPNPYEEEDNWGDKEKEISKSYYRDKMGRFRKKTS